MNWANYRVNASALLFYSKNAAECRILTPNGRHVGYRAVAIQPEQSIDIIGILRMPAAKSRDPLREARERS
jgi:hypothetical protein